jgi:signal transduction histidine kinase
LVATIAAFFAVYHLYTTVRDELNEQSERAIIERRAWAQGRVRAMTDDVRHAVFAKLASFHVEGLGYALKKWDDAEAAVVETFQSEPRGDPLWLMFRDWRAGHPTATSADLAMIGPYRSFAIRMLENPAFTAAELGYQGENLELLTYGKRVADPWAGWGGRADDPAAPWVFWYQAGPDASVRGCRFDIAPTVARLRAEFADSRLARIALVAKHELGAAPATAQGELDSALPGYALRVAPGEIFGEKQSNARFAAIGAVSLLGVFLTGAAFLLLFAGREAREAERKTNFVTQVSHELRTPLTSIQMFADMLGAPALPDEKRAKFAGSISRESRRLGALIERLLTFNALEKGKQAVVLASVDVVALARETLDEMEATLSAAGLRVEAQLPEVPMLAETDRSMLKQALINLLDNALKYARDGKVVRVTVECDDGLVRLRVADHGPGIAPPWRERIFEPFVQAGQTLTDKSPGIGLGLSIARESLRAAGGDLLLLPSAPGACFEIRLPTTSTP